jgi:hypothetical protein
MRNWLFKKERSTLLSVGLFNMNDKIDGSLERSVDMFTTAARAFSVAMGFVVAAFLAVGLKNCSFGTPEDIACKDSIVITPITNDAKYGNIRDVTCHHSEHIMSVEPADKEKVMVKCTCRVNVVKQKDAIKELQ